jgi:hypothetical protein
MATTEAIMTATPCPICGTALRHSADAMRCAECELDFEPEPEHG